MRLVEAAVVGHTERVAVEEGCRGEAVEVVSGPVLVDFSRG